MVTIGEWQQIERLDGTYGFALDIFVKYFAILQFSDISHADRVTLLGHRPGADFGVPNLYTTGDLSCGTRSSRFLLLLLLVALGGNFLLLLLLLFILLLSSRCLGSNCFPVSGLEFFVGLLVGFCGVYSISIHCIRVTGTFLGL